MDLEAHFRCCHALINLYQLDSQKLIEIFERKFFHQLSYLTSGGQRMPETVRYECILDILEFTESMLSDERIVNQLIAMTFGAIRYNDEAEEDEAGETSMEVSFVPASKSGIEALKKVSGLGCECVICLGNFAKQANGDCNVQWPEKSHLCPFEDILHFNL
ncbi:uncharacterized protein LOC111299974 [Durio zibethinus]|uniref:Uncharacterized protein LOC111299974 n=1 Tax=Durio zibethinus TaxID=66656 RepID=A0A6P5ZEK4_DURZI|nr:uncharacterized protein LOC111299974 [Durio zibethinus]